MRTCQSCGKENPPDQDFCSCGEYLRWEPTGYMQAVTPEMAAEAKDAEPAPPPPVPVTPDGGGNGHAQAPPPPPPPPPSPTRSSLPAVPAEPAPKAPEPRPVAKTMVRGAVQAPTPAPRHDEAEPATIVLRTPDGEVAKGEVLHTAVEPGQTQRVLALVRNQSGIVDNYDLRIEGMPEDWWSIHPGTVYLVPFGSGGTYEQEVEVHLHPPRTPAAEARVWELKVVADSKANRIVAAAAPLALHISPYVETATSLKPQRRRGRRKATYDVNITNKANAPVLVALDGEDPDGELQFGFNRPPQEIPPGGMLTVQMQVRPPKQIWLGRGRDHRIEVQTVTGEEAAARAAAEPLSAAVIENAPPPKKRRFWQRRAPRVPGVYPPRVFKPQLYAPDVNVGPGGLNVRMPKMRGPQLRGPQMGNVGSGAMGGKLKAPSLGSLRGGGSPQITGPLLPTQGVFRQRPWLPWWLVPLLLVLALLLFLLFRYVLPHNVVVPDVVGKPSAFEAEEELTKANLVLDPNQKTKVDDKVPAGTVLAQTPKAGVEAEKGAKVSLLIAVKSGKVTVPSIVGKTAADADKALREKELTLGQSTPADVDQAAKIESQIPAEGEIVQKGTPINIFFPDPEKKGAAKAGDDKDGDGKADGGGDGGDGGGGGGAAGQIRVPAIAGQDTKTYAKTLADLGIVPVTKKAFSDKPVGKPFATNPPGGALVKPNQKVTVLVSMGQPDVVFSNGKNILRINGATGAKLEPVAETSATELDPTWSADGTHVAYTADGQLMLKNVVKKNSRPLPLRPASEHYGDLAWAPVADANILAMRSDPINSDDSDLCFAEIRSDATDVSCKTEPGFAVIRALHWAPDGKSLLGVGVKLPRSGRFGIVRWTLKDGKQPFSPNEADWNKGKFVSDIDTAGKGVLDAAISPDGKRLALVSNIGASAFRLWLADNTGKADDFLLTNARRTPTRACKVSWRSDSAVVIVVQGDAGCGEDVSSLARVDAGSARDERSLSATGDDPSFRPPVSGG